jgi:protein associated with RNAse G/E
MIAKDNKSVLVIKLNPNREETWRYTGQILSQDETSMLIEAYFNRSDLLFNGILLRENDRFIERYFSNRWYNIFEIHDRDDDRIKGWYCNITKPAEFSPGKIAYIDLALDVLIYPDGTYLVLDEDEFADLEIDENTRQGALEGLKDLVSLVDEGEIEQMVR